MFYRKSRAQFSARTSRSANILFIILCSLVALHVAPAPMHAQSLERELAVPEQVEISIKNGNGRVTVVVADEQQRKVTFKAESAGESLGEGDVSAVVSGSRVEVEVQRRADVAKSGSSVGASRADRRRVDLTVRVPPRSQVKVTTEGGAVDVLGNVASADVQTDTGTIRADVPLDSLKYNFSWTASRPRFYSEVELAKVQERRSGTYEIEGRFGDKKADKNVRVQLNLTTARGVVLFGVSDPNNVPADLRERTLTESARAIIRSGNEVLIEAVRKVAPRLVGEYAQTLPPRSSAPMLVRTNRVSLADVSASPESNLTRLNASVVDRYGRAIGGLTAKDFSIFENGEPRRVEDVSTVNAPFNLVLLLDVSGSVEERLDFIRKAALAFLNTTSPRDRIAIISFRDDVQLVSDFTTDRALLAARIKKIDAGGGTALYDSLAYALVNTLKPLRGERTAVVILSDGDDNKSFVTFPAVLEATVESGALIYPLYVPSGLLPTGSTPAPETTLDPMRARFLSVTSRAEEEGRKLAEVSGGVYHPIRRLDDLQRAYNDVVTQLRTAYTITYNSAATDRRNARVHVRVGRDGAMVRLRPAVDVATP